MKLAEYEGADAFDLELQTLDPEYRDAQALELLPAGAVDPACGRGSSGGSDHAQQHWDDAPEPR